MKRKNQKDEAEKAVEVEEWRDVEGYEGEYRISSHGKVKSLKFKKHKILKGRLSDKGYDIVCLYKNKKPKNHSVHRLVALHFIPNPDNKKEVNHKNGIKHDNRVCNLEWCTRLENVKHSIETGLHNQFGENNSKHKLTEEQVSLILKKFNWEKGRFIEEVCREFGISRGTVRNIIENKNWKHIS